MRTILKRIRAALHAHDWEMTHGNAFYIPTQEFCKGCGECRHRVLIFGEPTSEKWKPGKRKVEAADSLEGLAANWDRAGFFGVAHDIRSRNAKTNQIEL